MYALYNALLLFASLGTLPYFGVKSLYTKKYRAGLRQRLGRVPPAVITALKGVRPLWLHAVSVGEVIAAAPLVDALRRRFPQLPILVSTVTETGQATAHDKMEADAFLYFPLDYPGVVRRVIGRIRPRLFLMVETEIWPNVLREMSRQGVPTMLVNGRISPRSFRGYQHLRPFMRQVLRSVETFSMQTQMDAERVMAIGAEPERVRITGNIKYDLPLQPLSTTEERELRAELGLGDAPVFMAGSTHRGEEDNILTAYLQAREQIPNLCLLLAPRHLDRLDEVEACVRGYQLRLRRRSWRPEGGLQPPAPVVLLDTLGELAKLYGLATVACVGGSFVPIGGHNVLEPAAHRKPIMFGPHMHNFLHIAAALLEAEGAVQVHDSARLGDAVLELLHRPERCQALGNAAYQVLRRNQGAIIRTLELIEPLLSRQPEA